MYVSLMGNFDFPAPIKFLGMVSAGKTVCIVVDRTNPWVLPSQVVPKVPLPVVEISYQDLVDATIDSVLTSSISEEIGEDYVHAWEVDSTYLHDFLNMV